MKTIRKTSYDVAKSIFNEVKELNLKKLTILEPSAGSGDLLDNIIKLFNEKNYKQYFKLIPQLIDCIETNDERREILTLKGYGVIGKDFLTHQFENEYDLILACPPFKNGIDIVHIQKMYKVLKKGGKIVTLTHPRWLMENYLSEAIEFRKFLSDKKYKLKLLPDNSFIEKGKNVPTCILVIDK